MRILVTGAAGFIGSNLTRYLIRAANHEVIAVDKLTYAGNRRSLVDLEDSDAFAFYQADICDSATMGQIARQHRPEAVMHLAAESHVDRSIDGPDAFIETNIVGTYRLLQAFRKYLETDGQDLKSVFRLLHVSTDEVFGSLGPDSPSFNESTPYDPHSPYSASKAASDHLVRAWHDTYGFPVLITNCSNNYGPYQFPEKLIPVVILKAIRGESIPVYGKGENIRDWLYVEDHARALERVLVAGELGRTYTIGGNNEIRNIDLVRMLCGILDRQRPPRDHGLSFDSYASLITFVADRPGHDLRYSIDASRVSRELGWQPLEANESGFDKTVKWYLDHESWWQEVLSGEYRLERQGLGTSPSGGGNS